MTTKKESKLKKALQLSKEDLNKKRIDRLYEDNKVKAVRSIEDDERKIADMELDLEDLLNPEKLEESNVFETYVKKNETIRLAKKSLELKKEVFTELFG